MGVIGMAWEEMVVRDFLILLVSHSVAFFIGVLM